MGLTSLTRRWQYFAIASLACTRLAYGGIRPDGKLISDMPLSVESPYAEALVAYYSGEYRLTLRLLDNIDASGLDKIKVMELRALALQYDGQYQEAVEQYRILMQLSAEQNVDQKEFVTFDYLTGLLMMVKGRWLEARLHLEHALPKGINRAFTAFLLGRACYELGDDRSATVYLRASRNKGTDITKVGAAYYLGLVLSRQNNRAEAVEIWRAGREEAEKFENAPESSNSLRETMRSLRDGFDRALSHHLESRVFGHAGLVTSYDSNPVLMPISDYTRFGQATISQMFRYQLGLRTNPAQSLEISPVLSGFTNFNSNSDTSIAQYVVQDAGLVMTISPLSTFRYGIRFDGRYFGRYDRSSSTVGTAGYDGSAGIFLQHQPSGQQSWGLDFFAQYLDFLTDSQFNTRLAMSGTNFEMRGHWQLQTRHRGFNPGLDGGFFYQNTDGSEWRGYGGELTFSDTIRFNDNLSWLLRAGFGVVSYPDRLNFFTEYPIRLGYDLTYRWGRSLRFGTQLSYLNNLTSRPSVFEFQRAIISGSMDYFF